MTEDFTNPADGTRTIIFDTPCGFQFTLLRTDRGGMKMRCNFNDMPINLTTAYYELSKDGALMLDDQIRKLFTYS